MRLLIMNYTLLDFMLTVTVTAGCNNKRQCRLGGTDNTKWIALVYVTPSVYCHFLNLILTAAFFSFKEKITSTIV